MEPREFINHERNHTELCTLLSHTWVPQLIILGSFVITFARTLIKLTQGADMGFKGADMD